LFRRETFLKESRPVRTIRFIIIAGYFIVGVVLAWDHGYLTVGWLRTLASALLAVFFWWLIPLGVNLHIHG
jgi:uncharacterized membrane protein